MIYLMLPTFKRINHLKTFIDSALRTSTKKLFKFAFCVNEKDIETQEFIKSYLNSSQYEMIFENTSFVNLPHYFNLLYNNVENKNFYVSMLGDDMIFRTDNWDEIIIDKINKAEDKKIIYCNDNFIAKDKLSVNLFTSRKIVDALEKPFMCTLFKAEMIDLIWFLIGKMTGLIEYLPDVIIEHNHQSKLPPDKWDFTFIRMQDLRIRINNNPLNFHLAKIYASICSFNLIKKGFGVWEDYQF